MGQGPSWEVQMLLDAAGAHWPNIDEDAFSDFALVLGSAANHMLSESGWVSGQLQSLQSEISADTFQALHNRWENHGHPGIARIAHDMQNVSQILFDTAQLIIKMKEAIIFHAAAIDLAEDVSILGTLGFGSAAARAAAGRALAGFINGKLEELADHVLAHVVDSQTVKGWESDIIDEVNGLLTRAAVELVA